MINYERSFRSPEEVVEKIRHALVKRVGLSLIRCGDGEAFSMGYDLVPNHQRIMRGYDYAGVPAASPTVRDSLVKSLLLADIVGLSDNREVNLCAPLLEKILLRNNINLPFICNARINWQLHGGGRGPLYPLLRGKRVLLVGRLAKSAAPKMLELGVNVTKTLNLEGYNQLPSVYNNVQRYSRQFDVALVAAGIPAVPLCVRMAKELNKVAIDFGHAINDILMPGFNVAHLGKTTVDWRRYYYKGIR